MSAYHLRPTREIEIFLQFVPADLQDIVMELRSIIAACAPGVTEEIHRHGLIYFDAARGGHVSAGVCQIRLRPGRIELAFVHGASLPDPSRLLVGDQVAMRHVDIRSYAAAPWPALQDLVAAAARHDPRAPLGSAEQGQ